MTLEIELEALNVLSTPSTTNLDTQPPENLYFDRNVPQEIMCRIVCLWHPVNTQRVWGWSLTD